MKTFGDKILQFDDELSKININLPTGFYLINPFNSTNKEKVSEITKKILW